MKALGVIVEYNPFHYGHLHHLNESKRIANPDVTVAVMSGHFMQRGEPAITNKWNRTQTALEAGVDLVVELPYAFANQSANLFAYGAMSILAHLEVSDVVFGSESGELTELEQLASELESLDIKAHLEAGHSLPKAIAKADPRFSGPNNTLGIHYLNALRKIGAPITLHTIARKDADYHAAEVSDSKIASATAIRKLILEGKDYTKYVPKPLIDAGISVQNWKSHYAFLRHKLTTLNSSYLSSIHDVKEGIENRLATSAKSSNSWADFIDRVATKRYTKTRIQRMCVNVLTGFEADMMPKEIEYIRVLGANEKGRAYLRKLASRDVQVPIYSTFHPDMAHDLKVAAAYGSVYAPEVMQAILEREYKGTPMML